MLRNIYIYTIRIYEYLYLFSSVLYYTRICIIIGMMVQNLLKSLKEQGTLYNYNSLSIISVIYIYKHAFIRRRNNGRQRPIGLVVKR